MREMPVLEILQQDRRETSTVELGVGLAAALNLDRHRVDLPCAGAGSCLHCRVQASGALSAPTEAEKALWGADMKTEGPRLACQCYVLGPVTVRLAQPRQMAQMLMGGGIGALRGDAFYAGAGAAVDVGTTTLAASLFTRDGAVFSAAAKNPQTQYGADVITRIQLALEGKGHELAVAVQNGVTALLKELAAEAGLSLKEIDALVITGNTAMLYLLTSASPEALSHAPFLADRTFGETLPAAQVLPDVAKSANVYLPPCVSAFVGADITTAMLGTGLCAEQTTALLLDIGTNGEVALWHNGELTCCATAAGPAFEGAGIENGVYAVHGAIDKVWAQDGAIQITTIGGAAPCGICGSGIIDALALLLREGVVDETGAFQLTGHKHTDKLVSVHGKPALKLAEGVVFTAEDVRKVQLAKAAIRAGLETLLTHAGIGEESVERFYIAGGFGHYLNLQNAVAIGLLPERLSWKARSAGNAALKGACDLLNGAASFAQAKGIAQSASTADLSTDPVFREQYIERMMFD